VSGPDRGRDAIDLVAARGEYLVLLNNDTIVTAGWLNHLIALVTMSAEVGMAGPMSNYAAPPQLVETVPYRIGPMKGSRFYGNLPVSDILVNVNEVQAFGQVLTKIGVDLEPWTDLSLFDTDILSTKARQAGFTLACCRDCFVHHFGMRTFAHGAAVKNALLA
jgi:GT2 family glycosyltransferase